MKKSNIFRVGDKVKIINPEFFVRVGYPLTKEIAKNTLITEDEKAQVRHLLKYSDCGSFDPYCLADSIYEDIIDRLAYFKIHQKGFGGNKRAIYTEKLSQYQDASFTVIEKRFVQTGVRQGAYQDYWSGEYESPYLDIEKTHILLKLALSWCDEREIESINVVKI